MAFKHLDVTLGATAAAVISTHTPVTWVRIESVTGNADVKIGDSNLSATSYGFIVEDGPANSKDIGPYGGGTSPFNLEEIFALGTNNQVIHLTYIPL